MMGDDFEFQLSLNVLEHFGVKAGHTFPQVIAEFVANAWDAAATNVEISVPQRTVDPSYTVEIRDDGVGMTPDEVNSAFLSIGRKRREEGSVRVGGSDRKRMGRKGIGFLSAFSVANVLELETRKDGQLTHIRIDLNDVVDQARDTGRETASPYFPEEVERSAVPEGESGSVVRLRRLERERRPRLDLIKQKIARQFAMDPGGFSVTLNGEEIDVADRNLKDRCEFTWDVSEDNVGPHGHSVSGWIGTFKNPVPEDIQPGIGIVVDGRLVQAPTHFQSGASAASEMRPHLVGTIHADFLGAERDLVSTNRTEVLWDVEPAASLKEVLREKIGTIAEEWEQKRRDKYSDDGVPKPRYLEGYTVDELIDDFEATRIEYKRELTSGKELAEEVAALANSKGGAVIVGVTNDGTAYGVEDPDEEEGQLINWVRDLVDPPIAPDVRVDQYDGEDVLVAEVASRSASPCSVDGRFVHKAGSRIQSMTFEDMREKWIE